jgi:hypothetical protein
VRPKEGMKVFAVYLKPSRILLQGCIMIGTECGQSDTGEREISWKEAISANLRSSREAQVDPLGISHGEFGIAISHLRLRREYFAVGLILTAFCGSAFYGSFWCAEG